MYHISHVTLLHVPSTLRPRWLERCKRVFSSVKGLVWLICVSCPFCKSCYTDWRNVWENVRENVPYIHQNEISPPSNQHISQKKCKDGLDFVDFWFDSCQIKNLLSSLKTVAYIGALIYPITFKRFILILCECCVHLFFLLYRNWLIDWLIDWLRI